MWVNWYDVWRKVWGVTVPSDPDPYQLDAIYYSSFMLSLGRKTAMNMKLTLVTCIGIFRRKDFHKAFEIGAEQKCDWIMWGLGSGRTKCRLTEEDEEMLWKSGVLGGESLTSLNHTVFYVLSQHFGWMDRGIEQCLVKWDRCVLQKHFASNIECYPVKLLISKRPADLCTCWPLYLTPLRKAHS